MISLSRLLSKPERWEVSVGAIAAALALASHLRIVTDTVLPQYARYVQWIPAAVVMLFLLRMAVAYYDYVKSGLMQANKYIVFPITLVILALVSLIYGKEQEHGTVVRVNMTVGGLFHTDRYIITFGREFVDAEHYDRWLIRDPKAPNQIGFSYVSEKSGQSATISSTGGAYILFYDRPIDKAIFRKMVFQAKAEDADCAMDLGIWFIVEEEKTRNQEVIYGIDSLGKYMHKKTVFDGTWQSFPIDLRDLHTVQAPYAGVSPGLTIDSINKVVFFIDGRIAEACSKNTLWLRDIVFTTG